MVDCLGSSNVYLSFLLKGQLFLPSSCKLQPFLGCFVTPGVSHLTEKWAVPLCLDYCNFKEIQYWPHVINICIMRFIALHCWNLMPCLNCTESCKTSWWLETCQGFSLSKLVCCTCTRENARL